MKLLTAADMVCELSTPGYHRPMPKRLPPLRTLAPYLLIAAGLLGLAGWWLANRAAPTPEQRVAAVIHQVAAGVERHDLRAIVGGISRQYRDSRGNDYEDIWRQAVRYVNSGERVRVAVSDLHAQVQGRLAVATLSVAVSGQGPLGEEIILHNQLGLHLRREGWRGRWRITGSEGWQATVEPYHD